jgi:hypothetical protein
MIVPGSPFVNVDHQFSWYAIVREKEGAKKQWTYWFNGSQLNREAVAAHIALYFSKVDVITIDQCTKMPERVLQPVPAHHFQLGVFQEMRDFDKKKYGVPLLARQTIRQRMTESANCECGGRKFIMLDGHRVPCARCASATI